jgi:tetratricopeptide (TPR) repeat protein
MRYFFSACAALLWLSSCSNDAASEDPLLAQPPYDKLTDSIKQEPKDAALHYRRAGLLFSNNQMDAAKQDLRTAWQLDPEEEYALGLTRILSMQNADSAIAFIHEALKQLPSSIALRVGLIRGYEKKNDVNAALKACDDVLSRYPGELDALLLKSELFKKEQRDSESLAVLQQAYNYAPADVELVHTLAFDLAEANNPRVLTLADSLIKADVNHRHAEPYYFKGVYYSNTGHPDEAIRQFDAAIQHDFKYMDAYINKGVVYYEQKKYAQALKIFDLATTVFPKEGEPYRWLAKTQEALGIKDEAKLNYDRAAGLEKQAEKDE